MGQVGLGRVKFLVQGEAHHRVLQLPRQSLVFTEHLAQDFFAGVAHAQDTQRGFIVEFRIEMAGAAEQRQFLPLFGVVQRVQPGASAVVAQGWFIAQWPGGMDEAEQVVVRGLFQ
ncbi:hypothetical protein D3C76_1490160 [compost metagenome]